MDFEPILLETSLGAIFHSVGNTFWASVIWDELLVKFFVLFNVSWWILYTILLILPDVLQRALVILALADMDHFFIWWMWSFHTYSHCRYIHHCWVVEWAISWEEWNSCVSIYSGNIIKSVLLCLLWRLHRLVRIILVKLYDLFLLSLKNIIF